MCTAPVEVRAHTIAAMEAIASSARTPAMPTTARCHLLRNDHELDAST